MLLYYPFWIFMGFTLHYYIIFGTNLLTGGPTRIVVFFDYLSVSKKRNIKRSPNGMKPSRAVFLEQTQPRGLGMEVKQQARRSRGCRCAPWVSARPHPRGPLERPPTYFFLLYISTYPENIQEHHKKTTSTAAPFCIREIPSWSLRRCFAGGGIDHGGPRRHLQGLSDEL